MTTTTPAANKSARRRWFRFSLRTMLVLVTLVCVFCWYLQWALDWKRQRERFLLSSEEWSETKLQDRFYETGPAPFALRIIGVRGMKSIALGWESEEEVVAIRELFPEADLYRFSDSLGGSALRIPAGSEFPPPRGEEFSIRVEMDYATR